MRFFLAQLLFPAEDSRLVDGGFRFGDQSFLMQSDGQRGERKRVVGFELGESLAGSHRFVKAVQLLQRARESMQGFRVRGIQGEALIVFRNRFFILASANRSRPLWKCASARSRSAATYRVYQ